MHVQDYGNIAVFFQDLLDTLHVERTVPFQDLRGLLRGGRNRREVINCRPSAIEPTNAFCIGPEADSTPPTNRISIPCASRGPFLFRLCSIVFTLRGPAASFQALLCSSARAESNMSSLVLRYYARRLAFFFSWREGILRKTTSLSYKERQTYNDRITRMIIVRTCTLLKIHNRQS